MISVDSLEVRGGVLGSVFDIFVPGESLGLEAGGVWIEWFDEVGFGEGHFVVGIVSLGGLSGCSARGSKRISPLWWGFSVISIGLPV